MKKTKAEFKRASTGDGKKIAVKIITVAISILALLLTFLYLNNVDRMARQTVTVARLKRNLAAKTPIAKDDLVSYDIIKQEFDSNMILWEEVDEVIEDKYSSYYIRAMTPLYKDQLTDEQPIPYPPLDVDDDLELLTVSFNYLDAGGSILVPGDRIRMRMSYEVEEMPQYSDDQIESYYQSSKTIIKTEVIFDSVVVTDMLNSSGHSILKVYEEVNRLDEKQRQETMKSKDFLSSVKPKALIFRLSPEDVMHYSKRAYGVSNANVLITILSRSKDFDSPIFSTLETEVGSWGKESQ